MATLAALFASANVSDNFEDTRSGFPTGDCEVMILGRAKDREKSNFKWSDIGLQGLTVARRPLPTPTENPDSAWEAYEVSAPGICKAIPKWKNAAALKAEYDTPNEERATYKINMSYGTPYYDQRQQKSVTPKVYRAL